MTVSVAVLIETWWNVNNVLPLAEGSVITVLIETWWNVNSFFDKMGFDQDTF